jgi:GNAT superfamily N-acetyltransferase
MSLQGPQLSQAIEVIPIDLSQAAHVEGLKAMLSEYAMSTEGGASPLQDEALERLPRLLASRSHYAGWLAWTHSPDSGPDDRRVPAIEGPRGLRRADGAPGEPAPSARCIGLLNAFEGISTFKAKPLLNIHDIAVTAQCRGRGVGRALMAAAEAYAKERGCCKLTLEVLEGNTRAIGLYRSVGFDPYELDPAMGRALFFEKWID